MTKDQQAKSTTPNLGSGNPIAVGKTAAEGKAAGEAGNREFKRQHEAAASRPIPTKGESSGGL